MQTQRKVRKVWIGIPCLSRGGTEVQTLLLVKALVDFGHEVVVCCYFEFDANVVAEYLIAGASVRLLYLSRSVGAFRLIHVLSRLFREESPFVLHVQYMSPGLLPVLAARLARVPVVFATVHQPGTPYGLRNHLLLRFASLLTSRFTCVSEATERSWFGDSYLLDTAHPERFARRRHLTIPNAIDIAAIDKALSVGSTKALDLRVRLSGKTVVGTVARLSREKGVDILLAAFALVHQAIPMSHLLVVGDGRQSAFLKDLAAQLRIAEAITWTGQVSWEDAIRCMGCMDIVAVPSRYEGFGLTAIEAMACGRPVVASRVDGLPELVRDMVTGRLTPLEDATALSTALIDLLKNEGRRKIMGAAARRHAEECYAYPQFLQRWRVLYSCLQDALRSQRSIG